jgi:hypothetical protein
VRGCEGARVRGCEGEWVRSAPRAVPRQVDRKVEAVGLARRVANKFDLEPECAIAVSSMLWTDGIEADRTEVHTRWHHQ